jgi:hypothetical protein
MNRYVRNHEKRSKLNEDRDARVAGGALSSSGTEASAVVSASQPLAAGPSQRELRPRSARTDAQLMDLDESFVNDTEEDEPYLRDPRDTAEDTKTDADADDMDEDAGDDGGDDDSDDGSEESAAGSSDLEGPLVTPAIQIPIR